MSQTLNEEKIQITEAIATGNIETKETNSNEDTAQDSSEIGIADKNTNEKKKVNEVEKKDPMNPKFEDENKGLIEDELNDDDKSEDAVEKAAITKGQTVEENIFQEEKIEPVESFKDFADTLNAAAKSAVQKIADQVEEKIEKVVEYEERKVVQSMLQEKGKALENGTNAKPEIPRVEETFSDKNVKSVESIKGVSNEISNFVIQKVAEKVEETTDKETEKEGIIEGQHLILVKEEALKNGNNTREEIEGKEKKSVVKPICTEESVKSLGSPLNTQEKNEKPEPDSLTIESSNEKNLSDESPAKTSTNTTKEPKQYEEGETQSVFKNSSTSEAGTPEETESFADIAQKIPFADENCDDILEEEGKAPIVEDDEANLVSKDVGKKPEVQNEESESQQANDSEISTDIAQEAEAEEEPCTEEVSEPVEAIIDDVEIESVSDNIETGSEQSTTSDTNDTKEIKKNSKKLLIGAILVAIIALVIAILSSDITSISRAIGLAKPEPKPIVKPFWKFF